MGFTAAGLSQRQRHLVDFMARTLRGQPPLTFHPEGKGLMGLKLDLDPRTFSHLFSSNGKDVSTSVKDYLHNIQSDPNARLAFEGVMFGYDIRIKDAPDEFWVVVAMAYAKSLVAKTGNRDGHIINIELDGFWRRHGRLASLVTQVLLKSGVCENGGGIIFNGIQDGGTAKSFSMLQDAVTGKQGNHFNFTVSHHSADGIVGAKLAMQGNVLCTDKLHEAIYDVAMTGQFLPQRVVKDPQDYIVALDGDMVPFFRDIAQRAIATRTTMPSTTPSDQVLAGVRIGLPIDRSALNLRVYHILRELGATVITRGDTQDIDEPTVVIDPNEQDRIPANKALLSWLLSLGDPEIVCVSGDPDYDRAHLVLGRPNHPYPFFKGKDLTALEMHNLATYNPRQRKMAVAGDLRASLALGKLTKALKANGYPVEFLVSPPGYNSHHDTLWEGLQAGYEVVYWTEETSHLGLRPYTSTELGAPRDLMDRGGDNAALTAIILLGIHKWMHPGIALADFLPQLWQQYSIPEAQVVELKPALDRKYGMAKAYIAQEIKQIVRQNFGANARYRLQEFDTGIAIFVDGINAMLYVRYGKSGSVLTLGGETIKGDEKAATFVRELGTALEQEGEKAAREVLADPSHKDHALDGFPIDLKDVRPVLDQIIASGRTPISVIDDAAKATD